ncbi:unnamed protein product [Penicillium olsonii]|nr:unnamed protein product [Penicillium olsonii]CAG7932293.1 unnamed protein product [Penicillium olsonii]
MLRRSICKVPRRAEWPSSACLVPSSTALTIRRTLRTSASRLNSESSSGSQDASPSDAAPAKPKFGSRWGPKATTQKPAGLSAAEQAARDAMVAASPAPPPKPISMWKKAGPQAAAPKQAGLSAAEQAMRDKILASKPPAPPQSSQPERSNQYRAQPRGRFGDQRERKGHMDAWPRPDQDQNPFQQRNNYGDNWGRSPRDRGSFQQRNPFHQHELPEENPFMAPKASNRDQTPTQRYSRPGMTRMDNRQLNSAEEWSCPSCRAHVLSYKVKCPFCKTDKPAEDRQEYPASESKLQQLGRSILSEMDHDAELDTKSHRGETNNINDAPEMDENAPQKQTVPWDLSALDNLESLELGTPEQEQPGKKGKRRDGRKGRESDFEKGDFDTEARDRLRNERKQQQRAKAERKASKKAEPAPLYLPEFISVGNLADVIGVKPAQFVARMGEMGFEDITYKDILDAETAGLVAAEYNYEAIFDDGANDIEAAPEPEDTSHLPSRPPVVTIMGHVDHGKTTILDWLRKSSVAASEHGGITQHIGAFSVNMPGGKAITFLDTPGHSAFLEMRRRGADVTDIVVLVVAADDSVKPQTIEAIKHANSANVPVIVAISKIDKEGKNPDKVKSDLSAHGVHVEDFGGDVQAIGVSGKTGVGMVELEDAIIALSEMLDHRADTACNVEGWVIEASTKSYGRVASALIRRGTLRPGDIIVAGTAWARVRTLRNEAGVSIDEATPGMPVEIDGWREQPGAGNEILQAPTEQKAKDVVEYRLEKSDTQKMGVDMAAINDARRETAEKRRLENEDEEDETRRKNAEPTGPKPVNFILKADVGGSAEAVMNSVTAVGNNEVYANVLRSGVGPISEFDVEHAATAKGRIISFNQPIDPHIMRMAEAEGVQIMDHNIIYKLTDEVKSILSDLLPPSVTTRVTGEAEVREIFQITVKGREKVIIAGSRVRNGMINKTRKVRVLRGEETLYDGAITSLKNVKKDVTEMRKDTECGIGFEDWADFAVGDRIQCYDEIFEKRYL